MENRSGNLRIDLADNGYDLFSGFFGIFQNPGDINIVEGTGEGSERVIKILPLVFGIIGIQTVSYTHLDVYKRQVSHR